MTELENDRNLQLADAVHDAVSTSKQTKAKIDVLLELNRDTYTLSRASLVKLSALLDLDTVLVENLYKENCHLSDGIAEILKKHSPKQD